MRNIGVLFFLCQFSALAQNDCLHSIIQQPIDVSVSQGMYAEFYCLSDLENSTYQWQTEFGEGNWVNLWEGAEYSGTNTSLLYLAFSGAGSATFRCVVTYEGCELISEEAILETTLNLTDYGQDQLEFYPNPAISELHISFPQELIGESVSFYSITSVLVCQHVIQDKEVLIDLGNFRTGFYLVYAPGFHPRFLEVIK